jgi:N-acetylmuramate 1-kinase
MPTRNADQRLYALQQWLQRVLDEPIQDIQVASADASFRRYFRIFVASGSYIAMDAPPDKEDIAPFVQIAQCFLKFGLHVPEIYQQNAEKGFLLLGDLGDEVYLKHLRADNVEKLYGDAMDALLLLQQGTFSNTNFLPEYDAVLLRNELELFRNCYLVQHLQLKLEKEQNLALDQVFGVLIQSALAQPRVFVHRDYHSRNLMLLSDHNPGILDFQDAVLGPVTYDLVSLLRDCYISWPKKQVENWVLGFREQAEEVHLPVGSDAAEFLRWFDLMGVQRHLKAIGIFARLQHRDGKSGYLGDIPRTMDYVKEVSARYNALQPLLKVIRDVTEDVV